MSGNGDTDGAKFRDEIFVELNGQTVNVQKASDPAVKLGELATDDEE